MPAMIQEIEIRAKLVALEGGELPLWHFRDWIERASFNMHRDSSDAAMDLVGNIGLLFADYDLRIISEKSLREQLLALLYPALLHHVVVSEYNSNVSRVSVTPVHWVSGSQWSQRAQVAVALQPL
jgi:hypothetical protein